MTREDQFIGQLERYLDEYEGITPLPEAVRDAIRAELPKTKQAGPLTGLARFSGMSNAYKVGIAAAVIGVAALIGFSLYNNRIGMPDDGTPSPSSSGDATVPAELQHPFLGPQRLVGNVQSGDRATLEFLDTNVVYDDGTTKRFRSFVAIVGADLIQLTASGASECDANAIGTYPYHLSPGGTILTIEAGEDECPNRSDAFIGDWQRSDCHNPDNWCLGNVEAGTYSSQYIEPRPVGEWQARFGALTYTVPDGWASYTDFPDTYGLTTSAEYDSVPGDECFDCGGQYEYLEVLVNPRAATPDCLETFQEGIGGSASEMAAYLSGHVGLDAGATQEIDVNGHPAIAIDIQPSADWTGTCDEANPFVGVPIFYKQGSYHWALPAGDRWHVILVDLQDGNTAAIVLDSDPATLDEWVQQAMPVIQTFEFAPR